MAHTLVLPIVTFGSLTPVTAIVPITTTGRNLNSIMVQTVGDIANRPLRVWSQQSPTINPAGSPGDYDLANFSFASTDVKEAATPLDRCGTPIPDAHQYIAVSFSPPPPGGYTSIDITIQLG